MTAADEKALGELKELDTKVEGLTSTITGILDSQKNFATIGDFEAITQALANDRDILERRLRAARQTAVEHQTISGREMDSLRTQFERLEQSFIDFQSELAARLEKIERTQSTNSNRIDSVASGTDEALRLAREALRVARNAQATADGAQRGVDGLEPRVKKGEDWDNWLSTTFFYKDGNSVLEDIRNQVNEHSKAIAALKKATTAMGMHLRDVRGGSYLPIWTIILTVLGALAGAVFSEEGPIFTILGIGIGLGFGAFIGLIVDVVMSHRKRNKSGTDSTDTKSTTNATATTAKEATA